jgi:hypothetical protein
MSDVTSMSNDALLELQGNLAQRALLLATEGIAPSESDTDEENRLAAELARRGLR